MDELVRRNWKLFLVEGLLFIILGMFAIALPNVATLSVEMIIGWLFLIGGILQGYRVYQARHLPDFWTSTIGPILSVIIGVLLLVYPITGILTLTMLLAIFFTIEGIAKIVIAFKSRPEKAWGWILFSGIVTLLLGIIIWSGWPGTAAWVMGLLVGINMLFFGWSLIGIAMMRSSDQAK